MLTYPIFYYLPFLVLVLSSCFIGKQLIQSSRRSKNWRKNRQAVVQLALVVISFIIGYLPNILYFLTTEHGKKDGYRVDYWMNLLCYVCLRLSECMNPFLYNVASTKMRRSSIRAVGKTLFFCFGFRWALWEKYEDQMIARAQRKCSITTGTTSLLFLDF
ncbi:unnamed protein product [Oikopleura dioica]|uniref:G-protein coupled receptors family 1 profile domain-containing protein n=1 Tax=Oikopleura dioica TaxID=34765 RepID=E4XST9_OIKDI|nr:unnamed protein product [Oikopleura dioica]